MRRYTSTYTVQIHYPLNGWVTLTLGGRRCTGLGPTQANRIAEDQRSSETYYARLPGCPARRVRVVHDQTGRAMWSAPTRRENVHTDTPESVAAVLLRHFGDRGAALAYALEKAAYPGDLAATYAEAAAILERGERPEAKPTPEPANGTLFPGSEVCRKISGPSRTSSRTPSMF